jgi:hypothetical protein
MRYRSVCGIALFLVLVGIAGPAFAQGGGNDVNEEVRRAVERAVGASVSTSVSESLSRSIVSEGMRQEGNTTIFFSPFYNRTDGDFDFASFTADTGGATVGFLQKLNDVVLLHGALAGAVTKAKTEIEGFGGTTRVESNFVDGRVGADFIFLNEMAIKGWFTLEGGVSRFASDVEDFDAIWAYRIAPSMTFSGRMGPILFEPTVAFAFGRAFEGVEDADTTVIFNPSFALKYRGDKFRPQLNFSYAKIISPAVISREEDGVISVGPEILYAIRPNILIGGAYSYSTPLTKGVNVDSHTATLEFRWIF